MKSHFLVPVFLLLAMIMLIPFCGIELTYSDQNKKVEMSSWIPVDNILNVDVFKIDKPYMATQIVSTEGFVVAHSTERVMDISELNDNCNYYVRVWSDSVNSKINFIHKI